MNKQIVKKALWGMTNSPLGTIDFRNGIYQGLRANQLPNGTGLFLDDNLTLHCSHWSKCDYNGPTTILISHSKYIYGDWRNGVPNGFNVFREGETVLLGNFKDGRTDGEFAIIFENHKLILIGHPTQGSFVIEAKREYSNEEQLQGVILSSIQNFDENYFSFVRYLNSHFCGQESPLHLEFDIDLYRFGFQNGLGVVFDDNNCIKKLGQLSSENKVVGLGVQFQDFVQAGSFGSHNTIKYQHKMKPVKDIKRLLRTEHKRSVNFKNDYLLTRQAEVIESLERIIKLGINSVIESPLETKRYLSKQDLEDSLEFRLRPQDDLAENERLKIIREELKLSIGPLSNIKPTSKELKYMSSYPKQGGELHCRQIQKPYDNLFYVSPPLHNKQRQTFLVQNRLQEYRFQNTYHPLTNQKVYDSFIPQLIQDHVAFQSGRSRPSQASPNKQSFSPSPIYSAKETNRNSPSKYIREFDTSIVKRSSNQLEINDSFNPKEHHTQRQVEELIEQIVMSDARDRESPYRKHVFDSNRENSGRRNLPPNFSRSHIPVSHQKKVRESPSPPQKTSETQKQKPSNSILKSVQKPSPLDRPARSYLQMFRGGTSPNKIVQAQTPNTKPIKSVSPNPAQTGKKTGTKQNKQLPQSEQKKNLYFQRKQPPIPESAEVRNKQIQQITRKYNQARNH